MFVMNWAANNITPACGGFATLRFALLGGPFQELRMRLVAFSFDYQLVTHSTMFRCHNPFIGLKSNDAGASACVACSFQLEINQCCQY